MKVEQLNNVQIDWTKPQVVVHSESGSKVVVVTSENSTQYPIELKLTIESDEELCTLLHDLALNMYVVNNNTKISLKHKANMSNYPLFDLINDLAKERNLYKND